MSKKQVFVVKGSTPYYGMWDDLDKIISVDKSEEPRQVTITCKDVTTMLGMFGNCSRLTTLDLSGFNTSNVRNMWHMFYDCPKLTTIKDVIDMKNYTDDNYEDMFYNCPKLAGVKIKNPPADFESKTGLSSSQYIVVNE